MREFIILILFLSPYFPLFAGAETIIESKTISKSETWTASKGPYRIQGDVVIESGATLSINSISDLYLDSGSLTVFGSLLINASTTPGSVKTSIHFGQSFSVPQIKSGLFELNNVSIDSCSSVAEIYNRGSFRLLDSSMSNCSDFKPIIAAWNNSEVLIGNTYFTNINAPSIVEVFFGATLVVHDSFFDNAARESIVSVHDNYASADIQYSEFKNSQSSGIQSFNNSILKVEGNTFSNLKSGLLLFTNAQSEIINNSFIGNNIGIESYGASSTVAGNLFESNIEYAALVSAGSFNAAGNWWGNSSGPYHIQKNINGTGDQVEGNLDIAPWLLEKPNNKKCCSTVLFFPGFQGSRLYTRGLFLENQLWEPNRDADVKKLFTNKDGSSIAKSVFTRDIVETTNIGFGFFDRDIYKGFIEYLKSLKKKKNIQDYKVVPYDWRYGSDALIQKNKENWISLISESAANSKTKKVILVGHSFGSLVIKKLLTELKSRGKSNLLDSVVFVGSPEQGAFESVLSVLHGDGQDLGSGIILSQSTARSFAENLGSVYELFPRNELADNFKNNVGDFSNQPFIKVHKNSKSRSAVFDLVKNSQDPNSLSLSSVSDLEDFVFAKGSLSGRVYPDSVLNIRTPSIGNYNLYKQQKTMAAEKPLNSGDLGVPGRIFNVLGTGLPTISGVEYSEKCFGGGGVVGEGSGVPLIWSFGAVRAQCLLDRSPMYTNSGDGVVPLGNSVQRPGTKIAINLADYNSVHGTNITHTDLISSDPAITIFNTILFGYNLSLAGAPYIRTIKDTVSLNDNSGTGMQDTNILDPFQNEISPVEYYRIQINSKDSIVLEDKTGKILKETKIGTAFVSENKIPNASYVQAGDTRFILLKEIPKKISLNGQVFGSVNVSIDKIVNQVNRSSSQSISYPVYIFPNIPTAPETKVVVSFASSTPFAEISVGATSTNQVNEIINPIVFTEGAKDPEYSLEDIKREIKKLKLDLRNSRVELKFQDRYVNKADALLRKIDNYPINKSVQYSTKIEESLSAIIAEIQEYRNRYYRGGMKVSDASYLYIKFFNIYKMFTFLKI